MRFICTQSNLLQGLSKVVAVAGRNKQLPILEHVLLTLREGALYATCTDLEIGIETIIPGKAESEGSCTVVARKITEYVQQLPTTNPLTLEVKNNSLYLKTEGFQAQFPIASAEDFPLLPTLSKGKLFNLSASNFCNVLSRALFASARDETRPEIHSVYIQGSGDYIIAAATDSFRLAEEHLHLGNGAADFMFLLPLATAQEIVRLFNNTETISLTPHNSHISVSGTGTTLISRLIDGKYPDYKQIIPKTFVTTGLVDKEVFIRALKTLLVFLPRDSRRVQLTVKPKKSIMALKVAGSATGEGDVELEFNGSGKDLIILFNIQYLLDGLQHIPGKNVLLKLVGTAEPAVFTPDTDSLQYTYVVMPIQAT